MNFKFINGWQFPEYESRLCTVDKNGESIYPGLEHVNKALEYVKKFGTAVDIGANVGLISVPLCKKFTNVISIECVPDTFECLDHNLEKFTNSKRYNFAVSDKNGFIEVAIPQHNGSIISSGWASISPERKNSFQEKILLKIESRTLDSLELKELDFLKIDVEQAELFVIKGALNTIEKFKPVIEFENKRGENIQVVRLLEQLGYITAPGRKRKASEAIMIPG